MTRCCSREGRKHCASAYLPRKSREGARKPGLSADPFWPLVRIIGSHQGTFRAALRGFHMLLLNVRQAGAAATPARRQPGGATRNPQRTSR
jgi:hypothetical protein